MLAFPLALFPEVDASLKTPDCELADNLINRAVGREEAATSRSSTYPRPL